MACLGWHGDLHGDGNDNGHVSQQTLWRLFF